MQAPLLGSESDMENDLYFFNRPYAEIHKLRDKMVSFWWEEVDRYYNSHDRKLTMKDHCKNVIQRETTLRNFFYVSHEGKAGQMTFHETKLKDEEAVAKAVRLFRKLCSKKEAEDKVKKDHEDQVSNSHGEGFKLSISLIGFPKTALTPDNDKDDGDEATSVKKRRRLRGALLQLAESLND